MIRFELQSNQLTVLLDRLQFETGAMDMHVGRGLRDTAEWVRTRAVRNVSGYPVSYEGGTFRVMVRTGALKGAIESEWPYGSPLAARVFVNGAHTSTRNVGGYNSRPVPVSQYAAAIEYGHGPIDLKKYMLGKTIPFFGARAQNARGPYTETGLASIGNGLYISKNPSGKRPGKQLVYKRKPTRTGSSYYIAFRKVGREGWVIPEAKPRPFMHAALAEGKTQARRLIGAQVKEGLTSA